MAENLAKLITAMSLTMMIELVVLFLMGCRDKRLWWSLPINLCTNGLLNVTVSFAASWHIAFQILLIVGLEGIVFLIEALLYDLLIKEKKNFLYSLVANLASGIGGSLLFFLLFSVIFHN